MDRKKLHKEVKINFIIPLSCSSEDEVNDIMKMAYQELKEAELSPEWQKEADCDITNATKNTVYVLQEFKGQLFVKLRATKSVVCGPMCLRSCIAEGLPIPENKSPVFTTAMRGIILTASQVSPAKKAEIKEKVGFMGGVYMNSLIQSVTHLVTNAVRSAKYEIACEKGIPAMTLDWVDAVWEQSQKKNIKATDPDLLRRYKCPVFLNMFITCSNLSKKEKEEMKNLINQNGGTFTTQMRQMETTLLVINEPRGEKYKHARMWDLPCVLPSYIRESVKCGYAVPSKGHLIAAKVSCSTPTKDEDLPNFTYNSEATVSMIQLDSSKTHIDDTQLTNCSVMSNTAQHRQSKPPGGGYAAVVDELNMSDAKRAGCFVDGCKIFLSGFTTSQVEKLRRILSLGGATLFSELNENVSHVLIGEFVVLDMQKQMSLGQKPHVVSVDWLAASIRQKAPACEDSYTCLGTKKVVPEPPSPLSQKGLQLLQPPQDNPDVSRMPPPAETPVNRKLFSEFLKENTRSPIKQTDTTKVNCTMSTEDSALPEIFTGMTFVIAGFDSVVMTNIESAINEAGGSVVAPTFTGVADYAVVPLQSALANITAVEVVTNFWLEDCLDNGEKLPLQYYHQPLSLDSDKKPLDGCCISLSNFFAKEKAFLTELVQLLGAHYQDIFARVAKKQGVLPSTHLVCPKPEGQKYAASVKWGVPAVTKDWLLSCARQGIRVAEEQFLVTNPQDTSWSHKSDIKANTGTPIACTPSISTTKTTKPVATPSPCITVPEQVTPAVAVPNRTVSSLKRKSTANTPDEQSPFHVATPDTPFGQTFETPTAETKKRWKKFIDDFPCKASSPPLASKDPRRNSTPLSELKRRIWKTALETSNDGDHLNHTPEGSENIHPRKVSAGRSTPGARDFKSACVTPLSQSSMANEAPEKAKKSPANEMVCAMLGQLHQRLSTPGSTSEEPQRPPQRELVSHTEQPSPLQQVATNQLPESQPVLIDWEDPVESAQRAKAMNSGGSTQKAQRRSISNSEEQRPRMFVLSNISDREEYEEKLKDIGETVLSSTLYDNRTTHLIVDEPVRSEKLLCCLAAGNWILHASFIDHMVKHKRYVPDEEKFEWGNPKSKDMLPSESLTGLALQLAEACYRWRKKLQSALGSGAFTGMRAIFFTSPNKQDAYKRLILAGGGHILQKWSFQQATHCFVDEKLVPTMPTPIAKFVELNIPCLYPIFLGDMLIKETPPSVKDGLISEYRRLQAEMNR